MPACSLMLTTAGFLQDLHILQSCDAAGSLAALCAGPRPFGGASIPNTH